MPILIALLLVLSALPRAAPTHTGAPQTALGAHATPTRVQTIREILLDAQSTELIVVAHRGGHEAAPENSIAAIEEAIAAGAHMVELDVRKTKDGRYVLMHDKSIDRTTTGAGRVDMLTLAQLRRHRLLLDDGTTPTTQRVPTLEQALRACEGRIMINIDPKAIDYKQAVAIARRLGVIDHCVFKSRLEKLDARTIEWFTQQPDVIFMPICEGQQSVREAMEVHDWPAIEIIVREPSDPLWSPGALTAIKDRGVRPWLNTLWDGRLSARQGDEQAQTAPDSVYHPIFAMGWGIIQTDAPQLVCESFARFMPQASPSTAP